MSKFLLWLFIVLAAFSGLAALNSCVNNMKETSCISAGGTFVENTSDASRSACIKSH